jgi:co-chaperonin GroES (HSP10)
MKLEPLAANVVVRLVADAPARGGLIKPVELERRPQTRAVVEAVGPEVRDVRVGQRVLVSRLQGVAVGDNLLVLPESAVLAFLEEGE